MVTMKCPQNLDSSGLTNKEPHHVFVMGFCALKPGFFSLAGASLRVSQLCGRAWGGVKLCEEGLFEIWGECQLCVRGLAPQDLLPLYSINMTLGDGVHINYFDFKR